VVNILLARGARNSNELDLANYIASVNMQLPPAEVGGGLSRLDFSFRLT
jgi:hypothetical protein